MRTLQGLASLGLALVCFQEVEGHGPRDLSEVLTPILDRAKIPALGAAVVSSKGLEAIGAVGLRSWEGESEVTVDDCWHIGSCTKMMTATLAARRKELSERPFYIRE